MPTVTPALYAVLSGFVEEHLGLHWSMHDSDLFVEKVTARAAEAGFQSLLDYYYFLRYDDPTGAELSALADALVVNESYLFREIEPLATLVRQLIAPAVAARGRARVWSAACAAGEEPYTLAMLCADAGILDRVEIIASDISRRVLRRAEAGSYPRRALRRLPPFELERYITVDDEKIRIAPSIHAAVQWRRVNLVDRAGYAALGTFDAILCRNVLIYFDDVRASEVVAGLAASLAPGGALLVGVSESLLRFATSLVCEEHEGNFLYRKPT